MHPPETAAVIIGIMGMFSAFWAVQRLSVQGWASFVLTIAAQAGGSLALLTLAVLAVDLHDMASLQTMRALVAILAAAFCLNLVSGAAILGRRLGSPAAMV